MSKIIRNHYENHVLKAIWKIVKTDYRVHKINSDTIFFIIFQETKESKILPSLTDFAFARKGYVKNIEKEKKSKVLQRIESNSKSVINFIDRNHSQPHLK